MDKGVRWQIGIGDLNAFTEPWIPRKGSFTPIARRTESMDSLKVADFFREGRWDRVALEASFFPYDVDAIMKIPLSISQRSDEMVWHFEENGLYSVKSGYRVAREVKEQGPSSSEDGGRGSWWVKMWALKIPPKIKHFI